MAIYHCSVKTGGRSSGGSSVASASYREGKKMDEERTGLTHDYTRKSDVIESMTLVPEVAPKSFKDSSVLWNAVEASEKRKDSQLYREVEVSLPRELPHSENKTLVIDYVQRNFVDKGMCATVAWHGSRDKENPHAHIMLTTRSVDEDGFGQKDRSWNDRNNVNIWREDWANSLNKALENNQIDQRVDHRSYEAQGINQTPTIHLGKSAAAMERRGFASERGDINRGIELENTQTKSLSHVVEQGVDRANQLFEQHQVEQAERAAQLAIEAQHREMHRQLLERQERARREAEREKERAERRKNNRGMSL